MPKLTDEQMKDLLKQTNLISLSLNVGKKNEEKALKECYEYIKNGDKAINDMTPLTIYYIISKLPEERQIAFLKENIKYIKEHDKDIFLYTMMEPKSLSYFFSFNVLKEFGIHINPILGMSSFPISFMHKKASSPILFTPSGSIILLNALQP